MPRSRKWSWTTHQLQKLEKVKEALQELENEKPVTLRQIYYKLVGWNIIPNNLSQYGMLSNLLKFARLDGYISWNDIEDRVRICHKFQTFNSPREFFQEQREDFLSGYSADLLSDQDVYLELWVEKDALSRIFLNQASRYGIPVNINRGYNSVTMFYEYAERVIPKISEGKKPVLSYWGDFDPSGLDMFDSMKISLTEELGIPGIEFIRHGLLLDDIIRYNLPVDPKAIKKGDSRALSHTLKHGELAVELDALPTPVLSEKIRAAIASILDMDKVEAAMIREREEARAIRRKKAYILSVIDNENLF